MDERETARQWDFFLAHAGADTATAVALYDALEPRASVFLDERSMRPGDVWTGILPVVLRQSRIIVVLVSPRTRNAWYQNSEIRVAINLLRDHPKRYRVIALLLDEAEPIRPSELPYGLEQTVPLSWAKCGGARGVAERLVETLAADDGHAPGVAAQAEPLLPNDNVTAFVGETERGPTRPLLVTGWDEFARHFGATLISERSYLAIAIRGFFENGGNRAYVARALGTGATHAKLHIPTEQADQTLVLTARSAGAYGNIIRVRVARGSRVGVRVSIWQERETRPGRGDESPSTVERVTAEDYDNLSPLASGPNPILQRLNAGSQLVSAEWTQQDRDGSAPALGEWMLLGGADGYASVREYLGDPDAPAPDRTGLAALVELDDIGIICIPDATHPRFAAAEQEALTGALIAHCERSTRFAVLAAAVDADQQTRDPLKAPADSSSVAIYVPWVTVPDLSTTAAIRLPPVGHIAGAYARHDRERGVHVSPVRLELTGVLADADRDLDCAKSEQAADELVRRGVNVLCRDPTTQRVMVASAVTMAIDESWQPIGVRRFFNFVERSLRAATAWTAFEPNNEATWAQVRAEIEAFLTTLWRGGVLRGSTPEEAFFVRCDRSTMTDDDIANGRLFWTMGMALAEPNLKVPMVAGALTREHRPSSP